MSGRGPIVRGAHAPEFAFRDERGAEVSSRTSRGRALVVAFVGGAVDAGRNDDMSGELRGLGASLLVFGAAEGWFLTADDPPRRLRLEAQGAGAAALTRSYGVEAREGSSAVFVVDAGGRVRWSGEFEGGGVDTLRLALRTAGEAVRSGEGPGPAAPAGLNRREMIVTTLASAFALALAEACAKHPSTSVTPPPATSRPAPNDGTVALTLTVNGVARPLRVEPRVTLLDALREGLGLTGTKKGCDQGQCGACTVLLEGRRVNACLTLAVMHEGAHVTTIEGLAKGDALHPLQAAFLEHDGLQCGYCTPGQIMSAAGLLAEGHASSEAEVREQMSGNICRCGAYPNIVRAVHAVIAGGKAG